jgi:hypothetical protein
MNKYITSVLFGACFVLGACTISVVDTHTESGSQETVDQDQDAAANVNPAINVPLKSANSSLNQTTPPTVTK